MFEATEFVVLRYATLCRPRVQPSRALPPRAAHTHTRLSSSTPCLCRTAAQGALTLTWPPQIPTCPARPTTGTIFPHPPEVALTLTSGACESPVAFPRVSGDSSDNIGGLPVVPPPLPCLPFHVTLVGLLIPAACPTLSGLRLRRSRDYPWWCQPQSRTHVHATM